MFHVILNVIGVEESMNKIIFEGIATHNLKNLDITNFDQELFYKIDKSYVSPKPINERFMMYGISIVLYNGP